VAARLAMTPPALKGTDMDTQDKDIVATFAIARNFTAANDACFTFDGAPISQQATHAVNGVIHGIDALVAPAKE
jgi:hypothetical protein